MSKTYKGDVTGNVVELNLLDANEGTLPNLGTPTVITKNTGANVVEQIVGPISSNAYGYGSNGGYDVKGLVIGTSCTSIGDNAFRNCSSLTGSLTIGNSVTTIGSHAFDYCTGLTGSLTIPDSVTSIGSYAFSYLGTTPLGTLTIGNSVTSIGSYAFSYSYFTGDLIIPDSVTTIGDSGFADWIFSHVTFNGNIVIGSGVTFIGSYAFYGVGTTALYINCPQSSWKGAWALINTSPLTNIYVHADYVTGYGASWKSSQGTTATVSTWNNYPNIP